MEKKQVIFLYSEIAAYFTACVERLSRYDNVAVTVIRWPLNKEAPFRFSLASTIAYYDRTDFSGDEQLIDFVRKLDPSVLYCSGWMDKGYLRVCKAFRNKIPVIVGMDNQWNGGLKQQIARIVNRARIHRFFSHCWVPGSLQREYALRLGFPPQNILTGFYSCDFDFFHQQYIANKAEKQESFPHRFLFVGRYNASKGVQALWTAFTELQSEQPNDWELWCLGTGDVKPAAHPSIRHFGFVQPADMPYYISKCGVFVLPSFFEPWGVVVHEYAAAGFPLIVSDAVGARTAFVEDDFNGYIYDAQNIDALKNALLKMIRSGDAALVRMGERSVEKAKQITPETWSRQLMSLLKKT